MSNTKSKIIIMMCAVLCIMAVGYAAFSTVLTITGTANIASEWKVVFTSITQVSKTSGVSIKSTPVASGTTATFNVGLTSPGDKIVYKITLANQGTIDAVIKNIGASATDSPAIIFTVDGVNIGDELKNKTSKDFTVTIEYDPHVTSQPDKLQKTLTVSIITEQKINQSIDSSTPNVTQPTYLRSEILKNNVAYADTNIDFKYSSEGCYHDSSSYSNVCDDSKVTNGLYVTSTNTEGNQPTYYFRGAVENNYVQFGKTDGCGYNGQPIYHVTDLATPDGTTEPAEEQCLSTTVCDAGTLLKEAYGIDYRYVTGVDAATCSYLGGTPTGQNAIYGDNTIDIIWRIVRINEDGSIRIVTQDMVGVSPFNTEYGDNAYVGYMYGATGQSGNNAYNLTHSNDNPSTIKTYLDDWYTANLSSYADRISKEAGFCNDRSLYSGKGYGTNATHYGTDNRLKNEYQPQFACPNEARDLFTTSGSTKGNKALTNPIGLLTADEVAYAGGVFEVDNPNMYLSGADTWTMSPFYFLGSLAYGWFVVSDGNAFSYYVDGVNGVRPVVNLQSGVEIISGDGTSGNPYVIK